MKPDAVYITLTELASAMGWNRQRALRWARREKVVFKVADRWVTTKKKIAAVFPEVWDRIYADRE